MSGDKTSSRVPAIQEILGALDEAERLFWADLALTSRRGVVLHVREASVSVVCGDQSAAIGVRTHRFWRRLFCRFFFRC